MESSLDAVITLEGNRPMRILVSWRSMHQLNLLVIRPEVKSSGFMRPQRAKKESIFFDAIKTVKAYVHSFTLGATTFFGFWLSALLNSDLIYNAICKCEFFQISSEI